MRIISQNNPWVKRNQQCYFTTKGYYTFRYVVGYKVNLHYSMKATVFVLATFGVILPKWEKVWITGSSIISGLC